MIQDVEELAPEFHPLGFGERERLHYREIDLFQYVATQDVAAGRAVSKARRRHGKSVCRIGSEREAIGVRGGIEPAVHLVRQHGRADLIGPGTYAGVGADLRTRWAQKVGRIAP